MIVLIGCQFLFLAFVGVEHLSESA